MQDPRHVSQCKYVLDLLKKIGMLGCKLLDTPMEIVTKDIEKMKNAPTDKGRYQRLVGIDLSTYHIQDLILVLR